jgi:hypothetical protein
MPNRVVQLMVAGVGVVGSVAAGGWASASTPGAISQHKAHRIQSQEQGVRPALSVANQTSNGFEVTVTSVSVPEGPTPGTAGFVAVASDLAGKPDEIRGYARVGERTTKQIKVVVADKLTTGKYFILLYSSARAPQKVGHPVRRAMAYITVS